MALIRGFNIGINMTESYFLPLALMGVKTARIEIRQNTPGDVALIQGLAALAAKFGIGLIPYCTVSDPVALPSWWFDVAAKWHSQPGFYGYDIANELTIDAVSHQTLMQKCINQIRFFEKDLPLIVQTWNGALPDTWAQFLLPKGDGLIFSFHMYYTQALTHQGVYPQYPLGPVYPSTAVYKNLLVTVLSAVAASGLPILVGEFSCARWAPVMTAYNYVRDCIDLFEERGWGWLYLNWRASPSWDAEMPEGMTAVAPYPARQDTDTLRYLKLRIGE